MDENAADAVHTDVAIELPRQGVRLQGIVGQPPDAQGVVVFAHGSGSGRRSPRNQFVARTLEQARFATLLFDLLTEAEEDEERHTRHLRFDIGLLAQRLLAVTGWLASQRALATLPVGYFGASTGAAAALVAAAEAARSGSTRIGAVVSRGGRPDLAGDALPDVRAPTLLIVGSEDAMVIELNRQALAGLHCTKQLVLVPNATHLFEEPGTLAMAAQLAADWFARHLRAEGA